MNIKLKLKYSQIIKLSRGFVTIILMFAAYLLGDFLYQNFYQVITHAEEIVVLRKEVAIEIVDVALFEKILNRLEEKKKDPPFKIKEIKDIFSSADLTSR